MVKFKYLVFGLFAGVLLLNFNSSFAKELQREARVIFVKDDVKIQKAGSTDWIGAREGMLLVDGDTAKTGKNSAIEVAFDKDKKNLFRLDENSTAILRGKTLNQVELPAGKIRFVIKSLKKESSFEIKTPTVVAGARGSGGDVIVGESADTVKAFEDELFVKSFDEEGNLIQEISIKEGWEVDIERFQAPGELVELTDTDKGDWGSWREDLGQRIEETAKEEAPASAPAEFAPIETIQQETIDKQSEYKEDMVQQDTSKFEEAKKEAEEVSEPVKEPEQGCY